MSLAYNTFVTLTNRPNYQLSGYNFSIGWKHVLYRKILDYELIPNVDFREDRNYVYNPGINTTINLNF